MAASADGSTVITGGPRDNNNVGAAWVFSVFTPITIPPIPTVNGWLLVLLAAMLAAVALTAVRP